MIHGHGDDIYKAKRDVVANFSTNVWYETDPEWIAVLLQRHAGAVLHYPEPDAVSFRQVVAAYHGVKPECVVAGNGATELFYLIAHAFAGASVALPVPSFQEYEDACRLYGHRLFFVTDLKEAVLPADVRLIFLCNPNNPDGRIFMPEEIRELLEKYPSAVLVVDESFIHFAPETSSVCPLLSAYPNLLVIRSMTKSYAIPGLRLGYLLGEAGLLKKISVYKQPWTVNALAIELGKEFLRQDCRLPDASRLLERQRCFSAAIAAIPGYSPLPSHTSFFLVRTDRDVPELKHVLLEKEGILIRDASNFRGLDRHYFRVNTLTEEKNELLIRALQRYVV